MEFLTRRLLQICSTNGTSKMLTITPFLHESAKTLNFLHTDTEKLFKSNLDKLPQDWIWRNRPISYQLNRLGRRMNKEVHEVDFNNYFAFFGCSYTVGIGLPLEETFAYRISQQEKVDYINAAIGGGSIEFVQADVVKLFSSAPSYPKVVFVCWPDCVRTMFWNYNSVNFYLPKRYEHLPSKHLYKQFLLDADNLNYRIANVVESVRTICRLANVKLVEFTISQSCDSFFSLLNVTRLTEMFKSKDINLHYARDVDNRGSHPGLSTQNEVISLWSQS